MDEQKLSELFREAATDVPPASFDLGGVRSASYRATARRRSAIAAGTSLVFVLLLGGGFVLSGGASHTSGTARQDASPGAAESTVPMIAQEPTVPNTGGTSPYSLPRDSSTQGDELPGSAGTADAGNASRGCVEVDRELAVALADELPVATPPAVPAVAQCPEGARGASYPVRDGADQGTVTVVFVPDGVAVLPTGASAPARGGTVYVFSTPAAGTGTGPFSSRLADIAVGVAGRL
ncbi:hypothetical protein GCM10022243_51850 [Saccharothrix violaceirubra]|uniref:Uncharacterized protein n=1 Tax=Saccharothrix violaceirubra TaxID=413306 RepID=A0A7W7WZE5_9PSEU|nr:hypothetical protein [Saccharothrix violaceirubra]MBB4969514.1 hypothetical protein [Saccharothrix violaceirubra]